MGDATLLPPNASARELAISEAAAEWFKIPVEILDTLWDPLTVPVQALPHLSAALAVDLYRADWSETKKRHAAADSPLLHRSKGTIPGIAAHLVINDAKLVEWRAPPQGVFASPTPTKAEMEAWYERLPQIRVYTIADTAPARDELYADDGCLDDPAEPDFAFPNLYPTLSPRKATYWRDGVETPLRTTRLIELEAQQPYTTIERVEVPTPPGQALFADDGCADDVENDFLDEDDGSVIVTYTIDRTYSATLSAFATTTVVPALKPISVRSERVSLFEPADDEAYADEATCDGLAYYPGAYDGHLGFDRLCYDDPAIAAPIAPALSFYDLDRLDMEDFRLEILVDVPGTVPVESLVADADFADEACAFAFDPGPEDRAAQAARVSKACRDQVLMTLATYRARTMTDGWPLDGSTAWDEPVPNSL